MRIHKVRMSRNGGHRWGKRLAGGDGSNSIAFGHTNFPSHMEVLEAFRNANSGGGTMIDKEVAGLKVGDRVNVLEGSKTVIIKTDQGDKEITEIGDDYLVFDKTSRWPKYLLTGVD